jgi:hypothetical protein
VGVRTTKYPAAAVGVAALAACAVVTPGEYGVPGGYTTTGGHFSGCLAVDGDVDLDDLSALKRNMGRGPPAASPASP